MTREDVPVRIFIGSGAASLLERKTLIHSIRKHTRRELEIWWYDGTAKRLENEAGEKRDCPEPSIPRNLAFATEFSLFRFLVPEICGHEGRAIYLDSDTVVLADIGELHDIPLHGAQFAARPDAYPEIAPRRWALSVMVIDCATCRFDLASVFGLVSEGRFTYPEFVQMGRRARDFLPYVIQPLPDAWNAFDRRDPTTRLVHYTDLGRQPWKYRYHPHGELWFEYFREACRSGSITDADVDDSIARRYVRADIRLGNRGSDTRATRLEARLRDAWLFARDAKRRAVHVIAGTDT